MEQSITQKNNSTDIWNRIWKDQGETEWRKQAMSRVYARICDLVPKGSRVIDIGGGTGSLADDLKDSNKGIATTVLDHSMIALRQAKAKGHQIYPCDLTEDLPRIAGYDVVCSTEVLEHFLYARRRKLYVELAKSRSAFISVPNNRLGPDEEPQHAVKFNAISFKRELESAWRKDEIRIEVLGPYLLAVCGEAAKKNFKLSVTLPVRDEAEDLEAVLASFRGVADEMIVGVDPRTKDNTVEVASLYADEVFMLDSPQGPPEEYQGDDGCHFSHCRNQCLERCSGDFIFMTEGHERLLSGEDLLLKLGELFPAEADVAFVMRTGTGQQWAFPWLHRRKDEIRYTRPVHNTLDYPAGTKFARFPQISTLHDRVHKRSVERAGQRGVQNRETLLEDWEVRRSTESLFYLAQEWREHDPSKAKEFLEQFLEASTNGVMKYQARLILAKELILCDEREKARLVLQGATADDWSRTEHFWWLGDLAYESGEFEKAYRFYSYAATTIGEPPFTVWWIDVCSYTYLPSLRLAMVCTELGRLEEALGWTRKYAEYLPADAPAAAFEEAQENIRILREAIGETKNETDRNP